MEEFPRHGRHRLRKWKVREGPVGGARCLHHGDPLVGEGSNRCHGGEGRVQGGYARDAGVDRHSRDTRGFGWEGKAKATGRTQMAEATSSAGKKGEDGQWT